MTPETRWLRPDDPGFPPQLQSLAPPPPVVAIAGEMTPSALAFAVVGTRKPTPEAAAFAREIARAIVENGGVVASGGAVGVDAAAHEGALEAGGVTWVVAATGPDATFPPENAGLFARVLDRGGVMVWPFEQGRKADPRTFFARNGVLVALTRGLVIVQAGIPSGTLNAARWARRLGRPVWAVCAPPWASGFAGCATTIEHGASPLVSIAAWLRAAGLTKGRRQAKKAPLAASTHVAAPTRPSAPTAILSADDLALLDVLSAFQPRHVDEIAAKSRRSVPDVATALLTLTLENVVVEGPEGQFRLATAR